MLPPLDAMPSVTRTSMSGSCIGCRCAKRWRGAGERGDYLPRSEQNWNPKAVFVDGIYQAEETWTIAAGDSFSPALHCCVGGNSKVYGAALFRLRERDFGELVHAGGISPA